MLNNISSSFVAIKTFFNCPEERTINRLSEKYNNINELEKSIAELLNKYLSDDQVFEKKVLLKPNWVMHDKSELDRLCLRTHDNFTLAVLHVILGRKPKEVLIGDAPVQGCHWDNLFSKYFLNSVEKLKNEYNIPVYIKDFRRTTLDISRNSLEKAKVSLNEYIIFDVANDSYLDPVCNDRVNLFRVSDYDPDRLLESHRPGMHKYCIIKELFDYDLIISLPKVKTHQKAGITNALKNIVGFNGDKDFLPHHRFGGTKRGGDCYPGKNILLHWAEILMDNANKRIGMPSYKILRLMAFRLWRLSFPSKYQNLGAGWHGNDTVWRMVMDLNLITLYGRKDGTLSNRPERVLYHLCDGIIGGQSDGPLKPEPLPLGIICFTDCPADADLALSSLMGFNYYNIPLLKAAWENKKERPATINWNDECIEFSDLNKYSIKTKPPSGWVGYL